jgi:predicted NBD/HSP70 family sugar kinase
MFKETKSMNQKKNFDYKYVFNQIRNHKSVSKSELEQLTGLKLTTLNRTVNGLLKDGMIRAAESGESSGGRRPLLYSVNPEAGYIVGVDISRTYTRIALTDLNCTVVKSASFGIFKESTPDNVFQKISDVISDFSKDISKEMILGIGVGVVGPLDREKGILLNPENFPAEGWENLYLKEILEEKTGLKVVVESGVNAAVAGEYHSGYGKGFGSMAYIIAGVGLRLGMLANGKTCDIDSEEFGHIVVDIDGTSCTCGSKGCLEAYVSIPAILKRFVEGLKKGISSSMAARLEYDTAEINFDSFCKAVEENDELAVEIVRDAARYFAAGITNVVKIASPQLIILGGPLIRKCDLFYRLSTENVLQDRCKNASTKIKFSKGVLEENAIVTGAANLVLDYFQV